MLRPQGGYQPQKSMVSKKLPSSKSAVMSPRSIFLLKSDVEMFHKRGSNVGGLVQPSIGDESVEYHHADLPPKVKALVWRSFRLKNWQAKTSLGDYCIQMSEAETTQVYDIWMCDQDSEDYPDEEPRGTLKAAKAEAQTHYEALVLGCLEGGGKSEIHKIKGKSNVK